MKLESCRKNEWCYQYYQGGTLGPVGVSNCAILCRLVCQVLINVSFTSERAYTNLFS